LKHSSGAMTSDHNCATMTSDYSEKMTYVMLREENLWNVSALQRVHFSNLVYGAELLAPRPTRKLEDHLLSVVSYCSFNTSTATHHLILTIVSLSCIEDYSSQG
jgi:hypothetical protein